jgi:hypothetical protein
VTIVDSGTVKTFCDAAVQLLPVIAHYASLEAERSPG